MKVTGANQLTLKQGDGQDYPGEPGVILGSLKVEGGRRRGAEMPHCGLHQHLAFSPVRPMSDF